MYAKYKNTYFYAKKIDDDTVELWKYKRDTYSGTVFHAEKHAFQININDCQLIQKIQFTATLDGQYPCVITNFYEDMAGIYTLSEKLAEIYNLAGSEMSGWYGGVKTSQLSDFAFEVIYTDNISVSDSISPENIVRDFYRFQRELG